MIARGPRAPLRVARFACLAYLVAIYIILRRFGPQGSPQLGRLHLAFFRSRLPLQADVRTARVRRDIAATQALPAGRPPLPHFRKCASPLTVPAAGLQPGGGVVDMSDRCSLRGCGGCDLPTHTLTHSLIHSFTHSLTHSPTNALNGHRPIRSPGVASTWPLAYDGKPS